MDIIILTSGPGGSGRSELRSRDEIYDHPIVYRTIGAYKIAHICRKEGLSVKVIDHVVHFSTEELINAIKTYIDKTTSILSISTTFIVEYGNVPKNIINAVSFISKEFPNLKIILGGHSTFVSRKIIEFNTYAVITNYGEDIFRDVANFICKGKPEPKFKIDINKKNGRLIKVYNSPRNQLYNIETDDFKFHPDDTIIKGEALPIEISRGCIFKCKFCNHLLLGRGKLDYLRNFELVKEELIYNYENWGTTSYYILCDTFNDTEYKMIEWHRIVSQLPFKINYTAYLRADLLDRFKDVPYLLKESGLISAFHGIETLDRSSALIVGKGWSGTKAKEYIPELYHNIWNKEVFQSLSFIAGLPGETKESIISTVDWFNKNDLKNLIYQPLYLTNAKKLRNLSEFESNAEKYGYTFEDKIIPPFNLPNWKNNYWSLEEVIKFLNTEIFPTLGINHHYFSSWSVIHCLALGISPDLVFNKKSYIKSDFVFNYIDTYKKLILKQIN